MAHPNLVKLFGFFDDAENVFLLMEYMEEGSLYNRLMRKGKLGETESGQILGEICQGVAYLHSREVLHRDIKP